MTREEYLEEVKNDVINHIEENHEKGDSISKEKLYDDCWIDDSVTGNASGSYYCNSYAAWEKLGNNIAELAEEIESNFGEIPSDRKYDFEYIDVSVRCMLLSEAIEEAVDELENDYDWRD